MELLRYARILRRRWALVIAAIALSVGTAALVTARTTPTYAASVTLMVSAPPDGPGASSAYTAVLLSQERTKSYAALLRSRRLAAAVARSLGDGTTADDLRGRITAEAIPDTVLVRATVRETSPARAQEVANALGTGFARFADELQSTSSGKGQAGNVTVADDADLPTAPESPRPLMNLGLGALAGLILGAAAAVLRETSDTSLRSGDALQAVTGATTLGVIAVQRGAARRPLIAPALADSPGTEAFRSLRTSVQLAGGGHPLGSLAVTSAVSDEGKSMIACNLAISFAEAGRRVVLVDADLRNPSVAEYLGIRAESGLTGVLRDGERLDDVLCAHGSGALSVLPSGPVTADPGALLCSERMIRLIEDLSERADVVVVDTPAMLFASEAAILVRRCTGTLLVTRYGSTPREQVERTVARITAAGATVLGGVLNFAPGTAPEAYAGGVRRLSLQRARLTGAP